MTATLAPHPEEPAKPASRGIGHARRQGIAWGRWRLVVIGGVLVALVLAAAGFAEFVAPFSPYDLDVAQMLKGPSGVHWLGTDELGRDVLSRAIYAARISVQVALVAVGVGLIGGTLIGIVAGYAGGVLDMALMRLMELLFSFPAILLAVVLMAAFGTSTTNAMLAIGIIFIPGFSRLARAATHGVLRQHYVEAARTIGMSDARILWREILPNIVTPLLVEAAVAFAYAVLLESALSFLGLGAQPPEPTWGNMLNTGRGFMAQAPWLGIVPGMAMFICVLGFNLLGDGLRDLFDPHLRE
jgi:peptide/nickel transport system permease protein